mgnify:CR=1 FL=1
MSQTPRPDLLKSLAGSNQVLYATHSPYMIFDYAPGNLLVVELDKKKEGDQTKEKKLGSGINGQVLNFVIGRLLEEDVIGPL